MCFISWGWVFTVAVSNEVKRTTTVNTPQLNYNHCMAVFATHTDIKTVEPMNVPHATRHKFFFLVNWFRVVRGNPDQPVFCNSSTFVNVVGIALW